MFPSRPDASDSPMLLRVNKVLYSQFGAISKNKKAARRGDAQLFVKKFDLMNGGRIS